MSLVSVLARIDADIEKSTDRLLDLLRIRSISTDPAYAEDCQKAADWLVRDLESLGAVATKRQTPGHGGGWACRWGWATYPVLRTL